MMEFLCPSNKRAHFVVVVQPQFISFPLTFLNMKVRQKKQFESVLYIQPCCKFWMHMKADLLGAFLCLGLEGAVNRTASGVCGSLASDKLLSTGKRGDQVSNLLD